MPKRRPIDALVLSIIDAERLRLPHYHEQYHDLLVLRLIYLPC